MTCWRTPRRLRGENGARVTQRFPNKGASVAGSQGRLWFVATRRKAFRSRF